ncbi:MAG: ClpXP protease specificity-enhancing factor [Nitrosomonadales bacterium]|nr:ClpXP protease specificity-enhancing factor [Nitrosomonadales bacterium]MBT4182687.1 ClpXP protease specificity-enhancing factor [Nitrosomonadales bacterium]MBT4571543.1 ClpXP protease specificity-enhancing factor [Nitrosomonadales bacterium]MBT6603142.1 ClpXP protease specificity-enhancing factor [Nitrosomonadales bacterium]MBT6818752.1 ClpXP protease specificity-enhancing factor [Nitrosomonadales bacterium]
MDKKPYLIRAIYDWCIDNVNTPYVMGRVDNKTLIPAALSNSKELVFNLSPESIQNLYIDDKGISFKGRFSGNSFNIFLPLTSIVGVYAKESGDGIFFSENEKMPSGDSGLNQSKTKSEKPKPHLTIVK